MTSLAGVTYVLIQWGDPIAAVVGGLGVVAGVLFVVVEAREREPMLHLSMFASRTFSAANAMTLLVCAGLLVTGGTVSWLLVPDRGVRR